MTLNQLTYFCKLAETQSYTRAAQALFIAQPSLSYAISTLEKELGCLLIGQSVDQLIHCLLGRAWGGGRGFGDRLRISGHGTLRKNGETDGDDRNDGEECGQDALEENIFSGVCDVIICLTSDTKRFCARS